MTSKLRKETCYCATLAFFDENDDVLETLFAARLDIFGTKFDCIPTCDCLESGFVDGLEPSFLKSTVPKRRLVVYRGDGIRLIYQSLIFLF